MDGAHPLTLDPLTLHEARDMLQQRLGKRRVAEEPDAVDDIVDGCSRLPLALAIAAARAALQPRLPLGVLAGELRDSRDALSALDGGDAAADVRAVFSWSYRQLSPAAGRLFRLLGLHPGPDVTAAAAVSVAALPLPRVRELLGELTRANLVVEHVPGRYTNHDLLHAYAAEQAHAGDDDERRAATVRMLDHYLHTAYAANRLTEPARDPITVAPPQPGVRPEHLPSHDSVRAWLDAEYRVLVRLIASATATGYDTHAWRLAWTLSNYLAARGVWEDYTAIQRLALEAGERLDDPAVQIRAHCNLASVHTWLDRFDPASDHLRRALALCLRSGDRNGEAHVHYNLAHLGERRGRYAEALDHAERARDLYLAAGNRQSYAYAVNGVGWLHGLLGDHEQSLATCRQALAMLEELDDRTGQASTWDSIGHAHRHLGRHGEAVTCYQRALQMHRELGDRQSEASSSSNLGDAYRSAGDLDAARRCWQHALDLLDVVEHTDAEVAGLRAKLAATTATPDGDHSRANR
jgi:tetratricopeptide (TPR) repeat protein